VRLSQECAPAISNDAHVLYMMPGRAAARLGAAEVGLRSAKGRRGQNFPEWRSSI
jgi:hypothetical protein